MDTYYVSIKPGHASSDIDRRRRYAAISGRLLYCRPDDDITTAEELMADNLVSRIMCIDEDGQLVGVISLSDMAVMDGPRAAKTLEQVSAREARLYVPLTPPVAHR